MDNPFRYCGEYLDNETGLIYLRARYYDPSIGAFVSEDPAMDGLNWYAYCGGNPVNFVDPSGCTIILLGEESDKNRLLKEISETTDDKLETNEDGTVSITSYAEDISKNKGSALVKSLVETDRTIYVCIDYTVNGSQTQFSEKAFTDGKSGLNGEGSDSLVIINPRQENNKNPLSIIVAHELIHAQRAAYGMVLRDNNEKEYVVNSKTHKAKLEELVVVGIWKQNENNPMRQTITENILREEQGYGKRSVY